MDETYDFEGCVTRLIRSSLFWESVGVLDQAEEACCCVGKQGQLAVISVGSCSF